MSPHYNEKPHERQVRKQDVSAQVGPLLKPVAADCIGSSVPWLASGGWRPTLAGAKAVSQTAGAGLLRGERQSEASVEGQGSKELKAMYRRGTQKGGKMPSLCENWLRVKATSVNLCGRKPAEQPGRPEAHPAWAQLW